VRSWPISRDKKALILQSFILLTSDDQASPNQLHSVIRNIKLENNNMKLIYQQIEASSYQASEIQQIEANPAS